MLGHFRVIERLGSGGMGAVYRALDESLQRYVALKVIEETRSSGSSDGGQVRRLLEEARAQARVRHRNVVHIYYVSREEDGSAETPFLAMELVEGETLADEIRRGPIPFARIIEVALGTAEALRQSARYDIVHGDVKPRNILLDEEGVVRLSDFGLARRLTRKGEDENPIAGTPNYMSPEACRGQPLDARSDQYSLGVMLYQMTFGSLPYTFEDDSAQSRIEAHCTAIPEFPEAWPDSLPEGWRVLLGKLLAKDPEDRYPDYDSLIEALGALQPLELPPAGRLVRGLAWAVDILLAFGLQAFLYAPFTVPSVIAYLSERPLLRILAASSSAVVPMMAAYFVARWRTSPGKKLFQIRIVSLHGLDPGRARLASRAAAQFLPIWLVVVSHVTLAFGIHSFGVLAIFVGLIVLLADAGLAMIRRDRRSLHDLSFGTQVVLDAAK